MSPEPDDFLAYPRPSVAADVVLLTVANGQLHVVLRRRDQGSHAGQRMLPGTMLRERFTMTQLRQVHDAVAGSAHQKDTFRRAMEPLLEALEERAVPPGGNGLGRPARIYQRRPDGYQPVMIMA